MQCIKRLTVFILTIGILITSLPFTCFAEATGDYEYAINNGTVTITAYTGTASAVVIPSAIDGLPVTEIGENAFLDCTFLESVTFPDTLKVIGDDAFEACTSLKAVSFPDSLESIGSYAFFNCMSLETIESTPYLYDIGFQAFHNTSWMIGAEKGFLYIGRVLYRYIGLADENAVITVPDHTAAIADGAFQGQYYISEVRLPVGIRTIGSLAFMNCYKLASVRIPPSVTSIGEHIFLSNTAVAINGTLGSVAHTYATEQDIQFIHDETLDYPDGDLDKDGNVSSSDIRILMKAILTSGECDHERFLSCDIVYDGTIGTDDIREWMLLSIM